LTADVTPDRLINADKEPQNWLMNHRTYDGQRFSPLARIDKGNVKNLRLAYAVTSRLHPDDAEAALGVLVGDALNQPSEHLPVGWLWLRPHDAHRTGVVGKTLARGAEVGRSLGARGSLSKPQLFVPN
jgi:hypothetical protein